MTEERTISIEMSQNEAIVLYEYLRRTDDLRPEDALVLEAAEESLLWDIEDGLEDELKDVVFLPNYKELVETARNEVKAKYPGEK